MEYIIEDIEAEHDDPFHYGDGEWGPDEARAERYSTLATAREELNEIDCVHLLRDRLVIRPVAQSSGA